MRILARISILRPRLVLGLWAAALIAALVFGAAARENLHETDLQIPGRPSQRAAELTEREFGSTISMAIVLKGPTKEINSEGPKLVKKLEEIDGVTILSPWDVSSQSTLRQPAGQALLTIQVSKPFEQISDETAPAVQKVLQEEIKSPLKAELTGLAPLIRALNQASLDSLDRGELIALPVLFILLLLVFRSPVAALIPALCGLVVTRTGMAIMGVANQVIEIDALALNMVTMIGLALGVDYSLLIVSRFREELESGSSIPDAVSQAVARAGRTVLFAGAALTAGMLGALLIAPGALLVSATVGVITATVLAVTVAVTAMPAGLTILGTNVNRWQFAGISSKNPWVGLAERILKKPGVAAFFVILPLAVLALPAAALDTGPPNVANLPPDNDSRKSFEAFQRDRGAGWAAPFEITFKARGPITTDNRLRMLERFQERISNEPGVAAVLGPAALRTRSEILRKMLNQLGTNGQQIGVFARKLTQLLGGAGRLNRGLIQGVAGADTLLNGLNSAAAGSGALASGTSTAAPLSRELASGVESTSSGASKVYKGAADADSGAQELKDPIDELSSTLTSQSESADVNLTDPLNSGQSAVQAALRSLADASATAQADPKVAQARSQLQTASTSLGTLNTNLTDTVTEIDGSATAAAEIQDAFDDLVAGLEDLSTGSKELDSGVATSATASSQLASGVDRLNSGSTQLDSGIDQLISGGQGGAGALTTGLKRLLAGSSKLGRGIQRLFDGVVELRQSAREQNREMERNGTSLNGTSSSGYFVLAGVEGSRMQTQVNLSFAINSENGGDTARVMVVPEGGPFDRSTAELRPILEREASRAAAEIGADELVGGPAVVLDDFDRATSARFPYLVLVLVLVTFLVLLMVFRSPVLALCAVLLNLVTVGAAVGVLALLFQSDPPILGGPGYLDAIALSGIFAIIFGLSIDYEVFLISRLLEGRHLTGTTEGAIHYSLEKTATIITGAAAIMAGVFIAFAISPVGNTRQFGVGLTVAVVLDATVVRLILLPALIKLFGERTWAVPSWLDRVLPRIKTH